MNFGERLKNARLDKGISQKDLADILGVKQSTVARYEKNINFPSQLVLKNIAEKLKIDISSLITGDSFIEKFGFNQKTISDLLAKIRTNKLTMGSSNAIVEMAMQKTKNELLVENKSVKPSGLFSKLVSLQIENTKLKDKNVELSDKIQELQSKLIEILEKQQKK